MGIPRTTTTGTSKLATENMRSINFKMAPADYEVLVQSIGKRNISPTMLVRELTLAYVEKQRSKTALT